MQINSTKDLDNRIEELEKNRILQEGMLTDRFHATIEHYRPKNLIMSAIHKVTDAHDTKSTLIKTAGGIGAGLLAKNLLLGSPATFLGKMAANVLKAGAANAVIHNSDKITAWGTAIYNNVFKKKSKDDVKKY